MSDNSDENIEELYEANIQENPFQLSGMKSGINKHLLEDNSSLDDEFLTGNNKNYGLEKQRNTSRLLSSYNEDDDDDNNDDDDDNDVSSISSVSDCSD